MYKALAIALPLSLMAAGAFVSTANAAQVYYANGYQNSFWTNGPDQYQGPHGHYASQTDFIRALNGTPCGIECTQREHQRWDGQR